MTLKETRMHLFVLELNPDWQIRMGMGGHLHICKRPGDYLPSELRHSSVVNARRSKKKLMQAISELGIDVTAFAQQLLDEIPDDAGSFDTYGQTNRIRAAWKAAYGKVPPFGF